MTVIKFNPRANSIVIEVEVKNIRGRVVKMLLDTGASYTVISPRVAEEIGFVLSELKTTTLYTASRPENVYELVLPLVFIEGEKVENVEARCMNLPEELKIDGLLGLNVLRNFNIYVLFGDGRLELEKLGGR